jgi:hypothetical protein
MPDHRKALTDATALTANGSDRISDLAYAYLEIHSALVTAGLCREGDPLDPAGIVDAGRKLAELQERISEYDFEDSDRLLELRNAIDERIGWRNDDDEEAGDYLGRLKQVAEELDALGVQRVKT